MRHVVRRTPSVAPSGLTLVEVLMSLMVTGIGIMSVIVLLPLSFIRAVQATNLTNGTILRYNAESQLDVSASLILRWQPNSTYTAGDTIIANLTPPVALTCTTAGTSGLVAPAWNTAPASTTTDNAVVWTAAAAGAFTSAFGPPGQFPPCFVIDPLGWNTLGGPLQTRLGNNGGGLVDPLAVPRFNAEQTSTNNAAQLVNLPDSWVEQLRGPVANPQPNSVDLANLDLTGIALPPQAVSRVVLIDSTGKVSQTRLITGITAPTISWSNTDNLPTGFTPVQVRVETQELRYTWMLTVHQNSGTSNVDVCVFFHRPMVANDEQVYQASGVDGVQAPFTVTYPSGAKPFVKKGSFMFDCYFGRWYRIVDVQNDTGTTMQIYVDRPRPQTDVIANVNFGVVFMRSIVDVFPLAPK